MSPLDVSDTDVVPDTEPASPSEPPVAVNSTVAPDILAELFRFVPATKLKSAPAVDVPVTLTLPESDMLTSPAALALRLATLVVRALAEPDSPKLPAVDVRFNVGVVMVPKLVLVISP